VTATPTSVTGGLPATGTVVLSAAAPASGIVVTLASSSSLVVVPDTVTVAPGSSSQTFDIRTQPAAGAASVTITATYNNTSQTATLTIGRLTLQNLSLSSTSVASGGHVAGIVAISAPAPDGGVEVDLFSSGAGVTVPAQVTVPAGDTSQVFDIATTVGAAAGTAVVTATMPYSGSTKSAQLFVGALALDSLTLGVNLAPGGVSILGTVALTVAAPADLSVLLASSSAAAVVPASVVVPAGAVSQTFPITTVGGALAVAATITASYGGSSRSAVFTVSSPPVITAFGCTTTSPVGGASVVCTGTLANPAPAGGWTLLLASDDTTIAGPLQGSVSIPASSSTFQFDVVTATQTAASVTVIRVIDAATGVVLFSQALTISPA
jgi:hypothetical protein